MKPDLTVIILTYNEEKHIERCIKSVKSVAKNIFVVDSHSEDRTAVLAKEMGASVVQHTWPGNQAEQFNWALENLQIGTEWVLRLDADEYITNELEQEIELKLPQLSDSVSGVVLPLRRVFLGRTINRGTGDIKMVRLFRFAKARYEKRWMDEHLHILEGKTIEFKHEFADHNLNDLSWWTEKHVGYAIREAVQLLDLEFNIIDKDNDFSNISKQASQKRDLKLKYARQPLFLRAFVYFLYRYIFKLGFLEGKEGFLWHFLQGWWYRTLVDAKIFEIKRACGDDPERIKQYIQTNYGLDL